MTFLELFQYPQAEEDAVRARGQQRRAMAFVTPKTTPTRSAKPTAEALYAETVEDSRSSYLMQQEQSESFEDAVHYLKYPRLIGPDNVVAKY